MKSFKTTPRISKELFAYYMSKKLNVSKKDIKRYRTYREVINIDDIILPYIKFNSPEFIGLLQRFRSVQLNGERLKGSFKYAIEYKDVKTHLGLGGVHGARMSPVSILILL